MSAEIVRDYEGNPLAEGARVEGWVDGVRYTAMVKEIEPHYPGCGDHRHIIVVRDDSGEETESFSNAVVVLKGAAS